MYIMILQLSLVSKKCFMCDDYWNIMDILVNLMVLFCLSLPVQLMGIMH